MSELANIKPGMVVKICATGSRGAERFWTLVQSAEGDTIHATVDNHLLSLGGWERNTFMALRNFPRGAG